VWGQIGVRGFLVGQDFRRKGIFSKLTQIEKSPRLMAHANNTWGSVRADRAARWWRRGRGFFVGARDYAESTVRESQAKRKPRSHPPRYCPSRIFYFQNALRSSAPPTFELFLTTGLSLSSLSLFSSRRCHPGDPEGLLGLVPCPVHLPPHALRQRSHARVSDVVYYFLPLSNFYSRERLSPKRTAVSP
jgi:hypothetical protein